MPAHYSSTPQKRKTKKPATPKGFHRMPDGKLMKGESHPKPKKDAPKKKEKPFDLKEGALSKQLGIPVEKNIPKILLRKIDKAEVGTKVMLPSGKEIKVTPLLHKRVRFVLNISLR